MKANFKKGDKVRIIKMQKPSNYDELIKSKLSPSEIYNQFTPEETNITGTILKREKVSYGGSSAGYKYLVEYNDGAQEKHSEKELRRLEE